jgi:hypothetical protein
MRYELTDDEWAAIKPMLPNKPRGVPRVNDRRLLDGTYALMSPRPSQFPSLSVRARRSGLRQVK